ncbi:hypothetical protein Q2K21_06245 [Streptomyces sp. CGMCC 4.7035]|nr:hypothetical protein [Streptomyces sp. CGMCC 4.7035]WNB97708.1 hypothetical protein Q2K21_06245 [Streptomyces sp. CGMCC 4.7035]
MGSEDHVCPSCGQPVATVVRRHKTLGAWVPLWRPGPCRNPECPAYVPPQPEETPRDRIREPVTEDPERTGVQEPGTKDPGRPGIQESGTSDPGRPDGRESGTSV